MDLKQRASSRALGSSILLAALLSVQILAQVALAGPTVTVYKSPT
ncbi:MAG TPA: hypothetical protein VEG60_10880 [Candidatus Binatia bacterium]|nr:hypothetical protein [Candidatus Binatia bacterium]